MSFLCHHPDQIWCATHIHFAFLKTALKIICSFPWIHSQRDRNICASFLLYYILAIAMTAALRFERTNLDLGIERIPGGRHRQLVRFIHPEVELRKRRGPIYQQGAENAGEQQAYGLHQNSVSWCALTSSLGERTATRTPASTGAPWEE